MMKNKKNIVFIRLQDFPPKSSIDMYYYWKYFGKKWYSVDIITWRKSTEVFLENVSIHYTNLKQKNNIFILFKFLLRTIKILKNLKKEKKIDYVYFFSMHPISIIIQFITKYIFWLKTIYDVTSWPIWNNFWSKLQYLFIKIWILLSDKFILDSKWLYKKLNLSTKKSYEIIWIWYDKELFFPETLNIFNWKKWEIIFTYVWTLNAERNLNIFLEAFISNILNNSKIKLYLIWAWTWENNLKAISKNYINTNIFFLWTKEHHEIPSYINSSDILVSYIPQVDYFNFQPPTKLIEYLACNKPVIATNTFSQNEILNWYEYLLHDDDYDSTREKINYFLNNYLKFKNTNYSEIVKNDSWDKLIDKLDLFISS